MAAARSAGIGHAALGHQGEQVLRRRQTRIGGAAQVLRHLGLLLRRGRHACQRQGEAESALRAAGSGRTLIPAMRLVQIAHGFRTRGQDVAEYRLAIGRAALGRLARPVKAGLEIRCRRLATREQPGARSAVRGNQAVDRQGGQLRLRLDIALVGRPLEPARAFGPAGRHAGTFQIAAANAVFRLGNAGARGAGQQRKGLLDVALLGQADRAAQCGGRRERNGQTVEEAHGCYASPALRRGTGACLTARASLRTRSAGRGPAGTA